MESGSSDPIEAAPPYTYIPGAMPHPQSDPRGHSYGQPPLATAPLEFSDWRRCGAYVRGLELFRAGYYWEAHESWEAAWRLATPGGPEADFLKALIKWAAAGVQWRTGRSAGVERHLRRAAELLRVACRGRAGVDCVAGLKVLELLQRIEGSLPASALPAPPAADGRPAALWSIEVDERV